MIKAELGDILYYIIFAVVILAGLLEKVTKSKRQQQQAGTTRPPQSYNDFEDVEQPSQRPNTLEEMMKRMMETVETPRHEEAVFSRSSEMDTEEAKSSEYIPISGRSFNHLEEVKTRQQFGEITFSPVLMEEEIELSAFEFDIRKAVIANEILNRKY